MKSRNKTLGLIGKQLGMVAVALVFASFFLWVSGYPATAIVRGLAQSFYTNIAGTIRWAAPLILSGLAVCVTYKAKIYNLGVDGQIYMGAAAATFAALHIQTGNHVANLLLVFLLAMVAGAMFALIPALMKVFLDTNEVVSTMLFNFVAALFIEFLVTGPLRDRTSGSNLNASLMLPENTWLPRISALAPSTANWGFYMAVLLGIFLLFLLNKTTLGYEIKIVGENHGFAEYGGIRSRRTTLQVMAISGAIAGIVGAIEVTAVQHRLLAGFNPSFGFDGIVVSLLTNHNPLGILFSGLFFGALKNGGTNMERMTNVPSAVTEIVMALIILIITANIVLPEIKKRWAPRKRGEAT